MDHIKNFVEDVKHEIIKIREFRKENPLVNYGINFLKCSFLHWLETSPEAAYIQSLFFVIAFLLSTDSFSRTIRVLLAQCFFILTEHILEYDFLSNLLMPMLMILNEDIESLINGILATRILQRIFKFGSRDQDILQIGVTPVFVAIWYGVFKNLC